MSSRPWPKLQDQLDAAGLSQLDIGLIVGVSQPQISARLTGDIDWSLKDLRKIAAYLELPVAALIEDPLEAEAQPCPH